MIINSGSRRQELQSYYQEIQQGTAKVLCLGGVYVACAINNEYFGFGTYKHIT